MTKVTIAAPSYRQDSSVQLSRRIAIVRRASLLMLALGAIACAAPVQTSTANAAAPSRSRAASSKPVGQTPAVSAEYARLESEVITELNAARQNPAAYAAHVEALIPQFHGMILDRPGSSVGIQTQEGVSAVREAVNALRAQAPVGSLSGSPALSAAARDLAANQRGGGVGHIGSDGSSPDSRISAHGTWGRTYNENISYGQFPTGRDVVVDLIVDDGVANRGHRRNIFDPNVHIAGVGCGPHRTYGMVCVIDQVGMYSAK